MAVVKDIFKCVLLLACIAFVLSLVKLAHDTDATVKAVPAEITATRSALTAEIQATRQELLETVRHDLIDKADLRLQSIQQMVDNRTAQALQIADSRLADATGAVKAVQADLHESSTRSGVDVGWKHASNTLQAFDSACGSS